MTPSEAATVMAFLLSAWPQAAKFWPIEHQDLLQEDLTKLELHPDQCIARLRKLARDHGTTLPDLRKGVWAALEALDRSQHVQAVARPQDGSWTICDHLRHRWSERNPDATRMSDDDVMWAYAGLRASESKWRAAALEFETRSLGWDRDRVRRVLTDRECYDGLDLVERRWAADDVAYERFMAAKGARA